MHAGQRATCRHRGAVTHGGPTSGGAGAAAPCEMGNRLVSSVVRSPCRALSRPVGARDDSRNSIVASCSMSVAVCADFPVMQTAARGDGLHVNRSCIGGTERFAVKKKGRNVPRSVEDPRRFMRGGMIRKVQFPEGAVHCRHGQGSSGSSGPQYFIPSVAYHSRGGL